MSAKFSEYRAWLASPEYRDQMRVLLGVPSTPPRDDYPLDVSHLIQMHSEIGDQLIRSAANHFKKAKALTAPIPEEIEA